MTIRYVHTNIIAKDWEKLSEFYIDVFDCEPCFPIRELSGKWLEEGTGVAGAEFKGIHLKLPGYDEKGPTLEIFQYKENLTRNETISANREGFGHLAFQVDDVEEMQKKVLKEGGKNLGKLVSKEIAGLGILNFVYVTDPEGNIIELQNWN